MSARIKFMALREGLHTIDQLRVVGVGDNYESIMRCVIFAFLNMRHEKLISASARSWMSL